MKDFGVKVSGEFLKLKMVMKSNVRKEKREQMNIVVVGHVDHGKSTLLGRLLFDTKSLPRAKMEQVERKCRENAKTFEYAFLLDALKDEQSQGITIDSARCFFKTKKRDYIIIDAPGHIEFLKNMVSGAARAEAAFLLIDAKEGIKENSKRHAYMLSMLGIKQVAVVVNKMDLVGCNEERFLQIKKDYTEFLKKIGIKPREFIAISAKKGDNVANVSKKMSWFNGKTTLSILDGFDKEKLPENKPFRMPVEDVYKFTTNNKDSRRIIVGRVDTGKLRAGDDVIFLPSHKQSQVKTIEEFNKKGKKEIKAGESTGIILTEQIYAKRGEVMCKLKDKLPFVSYSFKGNIFWMGRNPLVKGTEYKLKIGTQSLPVKITKIVSVLDTSKLKKIKKGKVEMHEVGECELLTKKPIAFDLYEDIKTAGRFVLVEDYEVSGGGIITDDLGENHTSTLKEVSEREKKWDYSSVIKERRMERYAQKAQIIIITGKSGLDKKQIAKVLEKRLFDSGRFVSFLGIRNILRGLDRDVPKKKKEEHLRRLGELGHILLQSGMITIITASDINKEEVKKLKILIGPSDVCFINLVVGQNKEDLKNLIGEDITLNDKSSIDKKVGKVIDFLKEMKYIFTY